MRKITIMFEAKYITPNFAVSPQLQPGDLYKIKAAGFKTIIGARPDEEDGVEFFSADVRKQAEALELDFHFVPAEPHDMFNPKVVNAFDAALKNSPGPILAYCKSGTRTAVLWALSASRRQSVDTVIKLSEDAGFEFDIMEDELEEQHELMTAEIAVEEIVSAEVIATDEVDLAK